MQSIVPFLLSFVLAITIGTMLLPSTKPKVKQASPRPAPAASVLDFLPGLPSLVLPPLDDVSGQYKTAWQAVRSGRYPDAERAYLQILIRHPQDQMAMRALVMAQRLAANQDRGILQGRAKRFRRAIAGEGAEDQQYTRQEMAFLLRANESALGELAAEDASRLTALSRTSIGRELVYAEAAPGPLVSPVRNAVTSVRNRIVSVASSLGLVSGRPADGGAERTRPLRPAMGPHSPQPASLKPARTSLQTTTAPPGTAGAIRYPPSQTARTGSTQVPASGTPVSHPDTDGVMSTPAGPTRPDQSSKGSAGSASTPPKDNGHEAGVSGDGRSGTGGGGSGGAGGPGAGNSGAGGGGSGGASGGPGGGTGASGGGGAGSGGASAGGAGTGIGGAAKAGNDEDDDKGDKGKGEKGSKGEKGKQKDD